MLMQPARRAAAGSLQSESRVPRSLYESIFLSVCRYIQRGGVQLVRLALAAARRAEGTRAVGKGRRRRQGRLGGGKGSARWRGDGCAARRRLKADAARARLRRRQSQWRGDGARRGWRRRGGGGGDAGWAGWARRRRQGRLGEARGVRGGDSGVVREQAVGREGARPDTGRGARYGEMWGSP